jgi:hypothetical protein
MTALRELLMPQAYLSVQIYADQQIHPTQVENAVRYRSVLMC